jgi:hypothetical protein
MKLCALQPLFVIPCATIVCVESAGLVLAVQVRHIQRNITLSPQQLIR